MELLDCIAASLAAASPADLEADDRTRAAVAMILRQGGSGLELFLIQRASHDQDPWSGHLAFPGGKVEPGEEPKQAAERETCEEVGLDLGKARYLGPLGEITGHSLPVRVAGYVYALNGCGSRPVLSDEVHDSFWVGFKDLLDDERHITATVTFDGRAHQVPAIRLPFADIPVLWGLTYRMVMNFMAICRLRGGADHLQYWENAIN